MEATVVEAAVVVATVVEATVVEAAVVGAAVGAVVVHVVPTVHTPLQQLRPVAQRPLCRKYGSKMMEK